MKFILQPWQLMLIILASWVNRQQQEVIEYLRGENAVLKKKFGKKRILLNNDQRYPFNPRDYPGSRSVTSHGKTEVAFNNR